MTPDTLADTLSDFIAQARAGQLDPDAIRAEASNPDPDTPPRGHLPDEPMNPEAWQGLHGRERKLAWMREWNKAHRSARREWRHTHKERRQRTPEQSARGRARRRQRMREDPEYAATVREKWRRDSQRKKERMQADPEYHAHVLELQKAARQRRKQRQQQEAQP